MDVSVLLILPCPCYVAQIVAWDLLYTLHRSFHQVHSEEHKCKTTITSSYLTGPAFSQISANGSGGSPYLINHWVFFIRRKFLCYLKYLHRSLECPLVYLQLTKVTNISLSFHTGIPFTAPLLFLPSYSLHFLDRGFVWVKHFPSSLPILKHYHTKTRGDWEKIKARWNNSRATRETIYSLMRSQIVFTKDSACWIRSKISECSNVAVGM